MCISVFSLIHATVWLIDFVLFLTYVRTYLTEHYHIKHQNNVSTYQKKMIDKSDMYRNEMLNWKSIIICTKNMLADTYLCMAVNSRSQCVDTSCMV